MLKSVLHINIGFLMGVAVTSLFYVGMPIILNEKFYPFASAIAVVFSAVLAFTSAFYTLRINSNKAIEKNTIEAIENGKGKIGAEFLFITSYLKKHQLCEHEALSELAQRYTEYEEIAGITKTLNELESICSNALSGYYDWNIIVKNRGATIINVWEKLKPYLEERRRIQKALISKDYPTLKHDKFLPFHSIEKAYDHLRKDPYNNRKEAKLLALASLCLLIPCSPALIAIYFNLFL
ncbi:DUF4760 domain-containing protein [Pseudoalteromonas sp. SG45-5]|uniref:DUF4760 domain-containing protein n=1 Tax=unclassified Pseudoalteromonas TaxID=194690 RepID=UPI0015FADECE|nr:MULTISPECIES: DUF4760 domain-containing protein [unclassified Pseudoalteromonas]MBB1384395.1 DUF4760 domain-containing protein [Pseudoalteromonas sp. SG45-5]MBB1392317.1 DUF4760 domain-containing protein [Pseudoalteromonas sp. SG44-4]MBB1446792.1 DUF4760 domain-containing protein [Pseudoalteromonas sp. SG41-6]